jgi:hypothetical protein
MWGSQIFTDLIEFDNTNEVKYIIGDIGEHSIIRVFIPYRILTKRDRPIGILKRAVQ